MPNEISQQRRYWVGVISASPVQRAVQGGFAQLCHGKAASLRRFEIGIEDFLSIAGSMLGDTA